LKIPLYILTFLVVFIAVTGLLIVANDQYNNIFKFDFSPRTYIDSTTTKQKNLAKDAAKEDTLKNVVDSLNVAVADSVITNADSTKKINEKSKELTARVSNKPSKIGKIEKKATIQSNVNQAAVNKLNTQQVQNQQNILTSKMPDSTYNKWKKATVKIYESMDPKKIAKIITSLSDNEAREIIYSMKKKKAAEILSYLNPDEVKRLTRLQ